MKIRGKLFLLLMITLSVQIIYLLTYTVFAYWIEDSALGKNTDIILKDDELEVYELINQYRRENGLDNLLYSKKLYEVAKIKAEDLISSQYFSHDSLIYGKTFNIIKSKGIDYTYAGENLAGNISPEKAVQAWINSTTHKDNILDDDYKYTAICVIDSEIYGSVFVQLFIGK